MMGMENAKPPKTSRFQTQGNRRTRTYFEALEATRRPNSSSSFNEQNRRTEALKVRLLMMAVTSPSMLITSMRTCITPLARRDI